MPTHLYLNPVASDRAEDFERFLTDVVVPAVRAQRPDLDGRWRVLRPSAPEASDPAVRTYALLLEGGTLEDWDLDRLLPAHYGAEEAERLMAGWVGTFVPVPEWLAALGKGVGDEPQVGWTFTGVG